MIFGIAQMSVSASKEHNVRAAVRAVETLASQGAELVSLPEMFCCPYDNESFLSNAEPAGSFVWKSMAECARKSGVYLIAGSMPEREGDRLYNTSFVFSDRGEQIARHRKVHLFDIQVQNGQHFCESAIFSAGREVTVFDTPHGKIGLCICFDMRFPELSRAMVLRGAQLIIAPAAFNMTTGPAHWELMLRSRAVDNQCFVAGIAPARDVNATYVSYGHSMIVSPWGVPILERDEKAGEDIVNIDFSEVSCIREQLPLLQARREDIY